MGLPAVRSKAQGCPAADESLALAHGPYRAPALKRGDRAFCLLRDCDVVVTGWSDAPIPWPRCRGLEGTRGGGSGLLLDEELARAMRCESAAAIRHWWGVGEGAVWRWRKALGVTRLSNEQTRELHRSAGRAAGAAMKARVWTAEEREARQQQALKQNTAARLEKHRPSPRWRKWELKLLGKLADVEVAGRTGRSPTAVRKRRAALGLCNPGKGYGPGRSAPWTPEEDALVETLKPTEAARRTGRTLSAVYSRRNVLGVPDGRVGNGRVPARRSGQ
jgi:hypothetical protein